MDFIVGFIAGTSFGFIVAGLLLNSSDRVESDHDMVQLELLRVAIRRDDPKPELLLRVTDMMIDKNQVMPSDEGE